MAAGDISTVATLRILAIFSKGNRTLSGSALMSFIISVLSKVPVDVHDAVSVGSSRYGRASSQTRHRVSTCGKGKTTRSRARVQSMLGSLTPLGFSSNSETRRPVFSAVVEKWILICSKDTMIKKTVRLCLLEVVNITIWAEGVGWGGVLRRLCIVP